VQQPNRNAAPPPSYWRDVTAPGPDCPPLAGDVDVDVAIVGAGFTGLSTALHLRERGARVVVVEAVEPGHGASGRNNGQVIPTLSRADPDMIAARHGEAGERFVGLLRDSADGLFKLAAEERIEAEAEQTGWVQPVHSPGRMKIAERRVREWAKHGAPVELIDRAAMAKKLGSEAWHGGWWNRTGGHVNPLALSRGLARAVIARGGQIFSDSPVVALNRAAPVWVATLPYARVTARAVIVATNAYTDAFAHLLTPEVAREVIPVLSWQMATKPISDNIAKTIIPDRQAMSDTHRELYFCRWDARNRLVTGGAAMFPGAGGDNLKPYLADRLRKLWPQIGDVEFDYVWSGYVGMTPDNLLKPQVPGFPRFHRLGPDGYAWAGCNGRAVALSVSLGRELAKITQGTPEGELGLPFSEPTPQPLQPLIRRIAPFALPLYRRLDAQEI